MTLALGVLFWIICIIVVALWLAGRPSPPWPWPGLLLFILIVILGIAEFGTLHLVR